MICIFSPVDKINGWNRPFAMFAKAIYILLNNYNIRTKIIQNVSEAKNDDIIFYFTGHLLQSSYVEQLSSLRQKVIVYNSEALSRYNDLITYIKTNENIILNIDYYGSNTKRFRSLGLISHCCPPVFHESYQSENLLNNLTENKEIDVLFYGSVSQRRKIILDKLIESGIKTVVVNSFNSIQEFESHILKTKIVLLISYLDEYRPIDYFRLNVLLSNNVFVIHEEIDESQFDERSFHCNKVVYSKYENIIQTCKSYLSKTSQELLEIANDAHIEFHQNTLKKRFPISMFKQLI